MDHLTQQGLHGLNFWLLELVYCYCLIATIKGTLKSFKIHFAPYNQFGYHFDIHQLLTYFGLAECIWNYVSNYSQCHRLKIKTSSCGKLMILKLRH